MTWWLWALVGIGAGFTCGVLAAVLVAVFCYIQWAKAVWGRT